VKFLVTGSTGQIGWELARQLPVLGEVVALDRGQMDLSDAGRIRQIIREVRPNILVNAAAYTSVDGAESDPLLARQINAVAPAILAEELRNKGGLLVHYSTDYVFDGSKQGLYTEEDQPNPVNKYGASKLEGEQAIQRSGVAHIILRTSWVYGARRNNFLLTMLRLLRERPEVKIVDDQVGSPTWSKWIAQSTVAVLRAQLTGNERVSGGAELSGIYHLTAGGRTSWCGFARAIREYLADSSKAARIVPISTRDYPTPARRPANSVLSNARLCAQIGLSQPDWRRLVGECMIDVAAPSLPE